MSGVIVSLGHAGPAAEKKSIFDTNKTMRLLYKLCVRIICILTNTSQDYVILPQYIGMLNLTST